MGCGSSRKTGSTGTVPRKRSPWAKGRIETRRCRTMGADSADLDLRHTLHAWPPRHRMVCRESKVQPNGCTRTQTRYVLSRGPARAADLRAAVRSHGSIEHALHWVWDVPCGEDAARARDPGGLSVPWLAVRRGCRPRAGPRGAEHRARHLREQDHTVQSLKAKRERAADHPDYIPRWLNLV